MTKTPLPTSLIRKTGNDCHRGNRRRSTTLPNTPPRSLKQEGPGYKAHRDELEALIGKPKLIEECGVFGVIGTKDAAALTALGLHALQHRGQEAAGISSYNGKHFHNERFLGLVSDNFSDAATLRALEGEAAIGHTRYSTQGETALRNVQPLYADLYAGGIAIAHNGNLTNARTLKAELVRNGCIFQSTSDSELFLQLTARSHQLSITDKLIDSLKQVEGAYALTVLTPGGLIGARDPVGIRPLILGELKGAPILASETCALEIIGATFVRDINPGEVVICKADGSVESRQVFPKPVQARPCIFELIYFAKPNSVVDGQSVYELRKRLANVSPRKRRATPTWSRQSRIQAFPPPSAIRRRPAVPMRWR